MEDIASSVNGALQERSLEFELKDYEMSLEEKVEQQTKAMRKLFMGAMESLVFALEAKDKYTAGHSRRVAEIATTIGKQRGLSQDELEDLNWAALLHDIGKIAIDPEVQNKPGRLTPEEYEYIMSHVHIGTHILSPVVNDRILEIVRHHHDRYDGTALGQTIGGEDIPLGAKIMAVADSFDAITSDRPYRSAQSIEKAIAEIKRCAGSQFDPVVVNTLLEIPALSLRSMMSKDYAFSKLEDEEATLNIPTSKSRKWIQ